MATNFYNLTLTETSIVLVVFGILFSFLLQLGIVFAYKYTHKGLSYSPSFIFTIVLIGVIGTVVMMVVQNNLVGAFALLGAFSLIRFRTILKETRDLAFVFFALVVGIAVGTGHYTIALVSMVLISLIILFMDRYNIGGMKSNLGFILTLNATDSLDLSIVRSLFSTYTHTFELIQTRTYGVGINSYVFSMNLKDSMDAAAVINALKKIPLISDVEMITGEHSVEY